MKTLRALWHRAKQAPQSLAEAEKLLRKVTREHPDFLPGWYNLALLLESQTPGESRHAWQEYLQREQRPEYRKIAEAHLGSLP